MATRLLERQLPPDEDKVLRAGFVVGERRLLVTMRDDPESELQRLVLAPLMEASDI
jgi:hypothetical protein